MRIFKVAITGPECSGKTVLSRELAAHFSEPLAAEYARDYLGETDGKYAYSDMVKMLEGQRKAENAALKTATKYCFFDTDMLVLKIWSLYRFGRVPYEIERAFEQNRYDLHLLCKPDLIWSPDPLRESPLQRERDLLYAMYRSQLEMAQRPYVEISGQGDDRIQLSLSVLKQLEDRIK